MTPLALAFMRITNPNIVKIVTLQKPSRLQDFRSNIVFDCYLTIKFNNYAGINVNKHFQISNSGYRKIASVQEKN